MPDIVNTDPDEEDMPSPTSSNPKTAPEVEESGIAAGGELSTEVRKKSEGQLEVSSEIDLSPMNNLLSPVNSNSKISLV